MNSEPSPSEAFALEYFESLREEIHLCVQSRIYRNILRGGQYILWDDLPGYDLVPEDLAEEAGVSFALKLGISLLRTQMHSMFSE
jgi:hypothetical protein